MNHSYRLKWFLLLLIFCMSTLSTMGQVYDGTWYSSTDRKFIVDGTAVTNFTDTLWFFCCCYNLTSSKVSDDTSRAIINNQFTASPWGGSASGTYNGTFVSDNLCTGMYTYVKLSGTCAGNAGTNTWTASRTPVMAQTPVPTNYSVDIQTTQTISWAAANGATGYRVFFGTSSNPGLVSTQTNTSYVPAGMSTGTIYYWRVDTTNSIGTTTGTVWQFTTTNSIATMLNINPSSTNISSSAASQMVIGVTANVGWTAMTNVAWLAVTGGASGTSNGVVTFSAAVNAGTTARTGGVIVAGGGITRTCTVVQAAMPLANDTCPGAISLADNLTYSLNTATATDDSTPGRGAINKGVWFTFTPSVTGTATVDTCTSDFDTVIEAMSGACGVPIAIANNDDNGPACTGSKASVSIACTAGATYLICAGGYSGSSGNLSVLAHAVAAVAALGISPTSTNISSAAAGQLSIGVTANISWTATTNAAWLAVTGGSPGSNNGTVFFSVATNTGTSARTGGVIVAGGGIARTCTVVQAGTPVQRIIGLSGNMAFGNVVTGKTKTALLTITNSGNTALAVTGIGYPAGFSGAWSGSVAAGQSTNVTVTFAPLLVQAYGGTATVASDATGGTGTIAVSGTGIGAHPQAQAGENFGVLSNRFGFSINWASGQVVVVDACTNLINPVWSPLQTNVLSNTPTYFSDPKWTNLLGRFYRIRAP